MMVTDIDILVKLGYPRETARLALAQADGNRSEALEIIRLGGRHGNSMEWKSYKPDEDWKNSIAAVDLPKDSQMRALWKSPVTAHVNSFFRDSNGSFVYRCHVITRSGDWTCNRKLEDFIDFRASLPLGTTIWFKSTLPSAWTNILSTLLYPSTAESARQMLDDWVRELTLSERCMSDDGLLEKTMRFFANNTTGEQMGVAVAATESSGSGLQKCKSGECRPAVRLYDSRSDNREGSSFPEILKKIRTVHADSFPVSLSTLDSLLSSGPFKIDVSEFPELNELARGGHRKKGSEQARSDSQLAKDVVRDRLIINGTRYQCSSSDSLPAVFLESLVSACVASLDSVLNSPSFSFSKRQGTGGADRVLAEDEVDFSLNILRAMSRTDSAYITLLGISAILDLSLTLSGPPPSGSARGGGGGGDVVSECDIPCPPMVVPESTLADPILINFQALERKAPSSPRKPSLSQPLVRESCVDCEGQTSTVYRVCRGDRLDTLLQFRVIYSHRTFGMLSTTDEEDNDKGKGSGTHLSLSEKAGPVHLVFLRETKTTARDWR
jgi:hypothetical protein